MTNYTKNKIKEIASNIFFTIIFIVIFMAVVWLVNSLIIRYMKTPPTSQILIIYSSSIFLIGVVCGRYIQKFLGSYNITQGIKDIDNEYVASVHLLGLLRHIESKGWKIGWKNFIDAFHQDDKTNKKIKP